LSSEQIWQHVSQLPTLVENAEFVLEGFGKKHNWTKKSTIWKLPYWKANFLHHNLDVMHIEKNFFDNILNTVMDVKGKTKDNVKTRMNLLENCKQLELKLYVGPNGKVVKPKANFFFTQVQKRLCVNG